ncbi:MAG: bifunctional metallophosphatase/5'-nucleotidase [Armatimonadota bacterium]
MRLTCSLLLSLLLGVALAGHAVPISVLATGDMHGWLEPQQVDGQTLGGAAELLAYWQRAEGYKPDRFLLLSCGDTATGPVLATLFKNDPMIAVMNLMGYDATALGNHEFDCGADALARWQQTAKFPFLSANLAKADGAQAEMPPYVINDEQGVKVGVIGLTTTELAAIANTGGLTATPYAAALRKWVPQARAKGAQTIIVAAHVRQSELIALAKEVADLNIPLMLGGHSHELGQVKIGNTWVVNTGEWWKSYSRVNLDYNPATGNTVVLSANQVWLQQGKARADKTVKAEIDRWKARLDREYNSPIGYTAAGLKRPEAMYNFATDCWLAMDPQADIALCNGGGLRQDIAPGPISKSTIIGVMPFTNKLVRVKLTGAQLLAYLPQGGGFIGMAGLRCKGGQYFLKDGKPIDPAAAYRVVMNDYMYNSSAALKAADPQPVITADDWRQPIYDWLAAHPTSKDKPLDGLVDAQPRIVP